MHIQYVYNENIYMAGYQKGALVQVASDFRVCVCVCARAREYICIYINIICI